MVYYSQMLLITGFGNEEGSKLDVKLQNIVVCMDVLIYYTHNICVYQVMALVCRENERTGVIIIDQVISALQNL